MKALLRLIPLLALPLLGGCADGYIVWDTGTSEEPQYEEVVIEPVEPAEYVPLHVGDTRQIVSVSDGGTFLTKIVGTARRTDGVKTYVQLEWWGTERSCPDTSYLFVDGGYLVYTDLFPVLDNFGFALYPDNPYAEQRAALVYPQGGEVWLDFEDDRFGIWWESHYYGDFSTPAGYLFDVFAYEADLADGYGHEISIMYAPEIGWCGTTDAETGERLFVLTFAEISGFQYGELQPDKDMPLMKKRNSNRIHPFGKRSIK